MQKELLTWYRSNKRDLPWRKNISPYRVWISEVMLQQTTVAAVIPYYNRFMELFPTVDSLAHASEKDVLAAWAGLGYYSRARNLHKAAKWIAANGFPNKADKLIELPGFGPYTSRAVASLAFNEPVGVLDGNVIRVLTRFHGLKIKWWLPKEKNKLQLISDQLAQTKYNSEINQGLMELGATLCTPQKPLCILCPVKKKCSSFQNNMVNQLPLSKPKQKLENWHWHMNISIKNNKIFLIPNLTTPFLTKIPFPPGKAQQIETKPKKYDIHHSVTKYKIYISIEKTRATKAASTNWFDLGQIKQINHTSLMTKILKKVTT